MNKIPFVFSNSRKGSFSVRGYSGSGILSFADLAIRNVFSLGITVNNGVPDLPSKAEADGSEIYLCVWEYDSGAGSCKEAFDYFGQGRAENYYLKQHQIIDFCIGRKSLLTAEGETAFLTKIGEVLVVVLVTMVNGRLGAELSLYDDTATSADMVLAVVIPELVD